MSHCHVCGQTLPPPLYRSPHAISITSLCEVLPQRVAVAFCAACGHLQTDALADLDAYYDRDYKILIGSADEDQFYAMVEGRKVFRTEHQVNTLLAKVHLPDGARVLDYGCAKSSSLRRLTELRPDIEPHVFDVSDMYLPYWNRFVRPENCSLYTPNPEWANRFDLITSFFALEHVADPRALAKTVAGLLKPDGLFYCIVPNVYANTADFVVADHVNHFSAASLRRLIEDAGMQVVSLDAHAHNSAWVLVATRKTPATPKSPAPEEHAGLEQQARDLAAYWSAFADRVRAFEATHPHAQAVAIYGSGFYGTFIATCLHQPEHVVCFLDQNPHRQSQRLLDKPILPPEKLPAEVTVIYVGLNPRIAREGIQSVAAWQGLAHDYFYP